jgi:hypothetical protein
MLYFRSLTVTNSFLSNLFVFINIRLTMHTAFDARTRSARELFRQVNIERFFQANPKLKVNPDIHSLPDAPRVKFSFVDGTDKEFNSVEFLADEMLMDVWRTVMKMDDDFEMEGKNVDDL